MARELKDINISGELINVKLTATGDPNKVLQQQEVDAKVATREPALGNPTNDNMLVASLADGTRFWIAVPNILDSTFIGLADTPPSYVGQQGKLIKVNATEDGMIFGDPSGATVSWGDIQGTLSNQTDLQVVLNLKANQSDLVQTNLDVTGLTNSKLNDVTAGTNVTIDKSDPLNPIISAAGGGGGAVDSVFTRTGVVVATLGDYAASLITNDSTVVGANVKLALDDLESHTITLDGEIGILAAALDVHTTDFNNPHSVTLAQVGGVPEAPNNSNAYSREGLTWVIAAKAEDVSHNATDIAGNTTNLSDHILDVANPHGVIASQVNNDSAVVGATVKDALETNADGIAGNTTVILGHVLDLANPHVVTAAQVGAIAEAPNDGKQYGRQSQAWSEVVSGGGSVYTVKMVVTLPSGVTSLSVRADTNSPIKVTQNGVSKIKTGIKYAFGFNQTDAVVFTGLNDASPITVELTDSTSFVNFGSPSIKTIDIVSVGSMGALPYFLNSHTDLTSVVISGDITGIGDFISAFRTCNSLTSFPALVTPYATGFFNTFNACSSLVTMASIDFSGLEDGTTTFSGCTVLTQPPVTGSAVRNSTEGTAGTFTAP